MSQPAKGDGFYYHQPSPKTQALIGENRRRFRELRDWLKSLPQTRELSLSLTNLQQAAMWANAALALADPEAAVEE